MKFPSTPCETPTALWRRYWLLWLLLVNGLLLLALAGVIWTDNSLNRGIHYTPDATPIPWTDGPQVGVNVYNLHVEPDPAVVRRTLELAHSLGVRYIRMQMPWDDVEIHGRGDFEDRRNVATVGVVSAWAKYDRIVQIANELGLELILRLDRPPAWARQAGNAERFFQEGLTDDGNSTGPPDDFADYGRFVGTVVQRYRGQVRFFQIWNEPNLKTEWGWHTPSPASFMVLLRAAYMAGKAENPDAVFIFPSLAPSDGLDQRAPMTELEYLDGVYATGGAQFFDVMSVQAYGLGQPPDEHRYVRLMPLTDWRTWWRRPLDTRTDVSRIVLLREVMEQNGDAHKPIWIGEFGWNSAPETIPEWRRMTWGPPVSEQQKADYIIGFIERARQEWPWMGVLNVWKLRHGGYREPDVDDPTPYFSLIHRDWTLLPAYTRLQAYLAEPAVAGLGAHTWQHPAVTVISDGWRLRFTGQQVTLVGGLNGAPRITLDGQEMTPAQQAIDGAQARIIPSHGQDNTAHVLDIIAPGGEPPEHFVVARDPPFPLWLWTLLPTLLIGLLVLSGSVLLPPLFHQVHSLIARSPPGRLGVRAWLATPGGEWTLLAGMFTGILIFYGVTNDLPTRIVGAAIFGILACIRPDLALLYVPLTVPFFFMPKGVWDDRFGLPTDGIRLPLHEVLLLLVAGATIVRQGLGSLVLHRREGSVARRFIAGVGSRFWSLAPVGLFLLASTLGVLIAASEGRSVALREWRWTIVEPLLFYALLHYHCGRTRNPEPTTQNQEPRTHNPESGIHNPQPRTDSPKAGSQVSGRGFPCSRLHSPFSMLTSWLAGGALVGLLGLLQFFGLNLVPLIGTKVTFSDDNIVVEGVRRVSSVYGHPNNLGLYMGRLWPVALVLAVGAAFALRARNREPRTRNQELGTEYPPSPPAMNRRAAQPPIMGWFVLATVCLLLTAGGLVVSFSKGALLGAVGALALLVVLAGRRIVSHLPDISQGIAWSATQWRLYGFIAAMGMVVVLPILAAFVAAGVDIDRLNPLGESSGIRMKLWASSVAMLRDHLLLGIGLDQFLRLYPAYIDPSLLGTNEVYTAHPHNLVLDVWLRLGILGIVAFGWLLVHFYRNILCGNPSLLHYGLAAAMTAALLHGLVDNFYFVPDLAFAFWLLVWAGERMGGDVDSRGEAGLFQA